MLRGCTVLSIPILSCPIRTPAPPRRLSPLRSAHGHHAFRLARHQRGCCCRASHSSLGGHRCSSALCSQASSMGGHPHSSRASVISYGHRLSRRVLVTHSSTVSHPLPRRSGVYVHVFRLQSLPCASGYVPDMWRGVFVFRTLGQGRGKNVDSGGTESRRPPVLLCSDRELILLLLHASKLLERARSALLKLCAHRYSLQDTFELQLLHGRLLHGGSVNFSHDRHWSNPFGTFYSPLLLLILRVLECPAVPPKFSAPLSLLRV